MDRFFLNKDNAILVIVDIQERLASVMADRQKVTKNCLHLIEISKMLSIPIILTEQYPKGLGPTVSEIKEAVQPYAPVEKISFDCCMEPQFNEAIAPLNRKKIMVAGMETHICVLQTSLGLMEQGYDVHVVSDAVCSRSKDNHKAGIGLMRDAGAVVSCAETVLFQLLEKAGTEEFRAISKRIK